MKLTAIMGSVDEERDIVVQITRHFKSIEVSSSRLERLVKAVCNRFGLSQATVSIAIVDDAEIAELNKRFLNHERATDCLSFDLSDDVLNLPDPVGSAPASPNRRSEIENRKLFELVANGQRAAEQARLRGLSPDAELALYITHGLLHQLGFDDSTVELADKMHETEDEILTEQGFGPVYNKDTR
jgi:probable rRNA maturation factor